MPSRTRAAINKGYGIDPRIYDDYLLQPHIMWGMTGRMKKSRGGKAMFRKGSPEAKKHMAYLRSLRGKGSYTDAALEGYGSYTNAALEGYGLVDVLTPLTEQFGDGITNLVKALAVKLGTTLSDLATNPDKLLAAINEYAPSIFSKVKNFFNKLFRKKKRLPTKKELAALKKYLKEQSKQKSKYPFMPKPKPKPKPLPLPYYDSDEDEDMEEEDFYTKPAPRKSSGAEERMRRLMEQRSLRSYMDDVD